MIDVVITTMHKKRADGKEFLDVLLESLPQSIFDGPDFKAIIIENYSPYARAVNEGLSRCKNDVLLLNDDIIMLPGWGKILEAHGDIRGFKLLYPPGLVIQHAGGLIASDFTTRHVGQGAFDCGQFQAMTPMPYVTFGAVFIKRQVYEALGPLSTFSKIFFEDADYCLRAWEAGFEVFYHPIPLIHDECGTMGRDTGNYFTTAREAFRRKWAKEETIEMLSGKIDSAWGKLLGENKA